MAFKMKNNSMAKLAKEVSTRKQNRVIKRMNKLEDKAAKFNKQGEDKKAQRKIDKISKLEDKLLPGLSPVKLKDEKGPGQGTKVGQYTGAGIPENLYNADGKKINTNNIDEGNLSAIKVEKGTDRKYVVMQEKTDLGGAGSRFYLSKPKK